MNKSFERRIPVPVEKRQRYIEAVLTGNAKRYETSISYLDLPLKTISLKDFLDVNTRSIQKSFNRTVYRKQFIREVMRENGTNKKKALKLILLVDPVIAHSHRQMQDCETHYRCEIRYSPYRSTSFDMTIKDYEETCSELPLDHLVKAA